MAEKEKNKSVAAAGEGGGTNAALLTQAIGSAVGTAIKEALGPITTRIEAMSEKLDKSSSDVEELKGLYVIEAAGKRDEEDDDDDDDMAAKREEEDDDDDDMSAARREEEDEDEEDMSAARKKDEDEEEEDDDDVDAALEDLEKEAAVEEPGEVNKRRGGKNKGDKNYTTDPPTQGAKVSGNIAEKRLKSAAYGAKPFPGVKGGAIQAAAIQIHTLVASVKKANRQAKRAMQAAAEMAGENKKMRKLVKKMNAQLDRAAEQTNRRSVLPIEVRNLLAKGGVDVHQLQASGQKLSIEAMDEVFKECEKSQGIILEPHQRAGMKNVLTQRGLLESGEIDRGYTN